MQTAEPLAKAPTGIRGLDEITNGGLPRGRPTLVCGAPGCGKTLLGMQFLINGLRDFGEPAVFLSFEEPVEELRTNFASLGFDLDRWESQGLLKLDHVKLNRHDIVEAGDYDLEGLFIRLGAAIDAAQARRVVLDTIEVLFSTFGNDRILRSELSRLFRFLKSKGVTAVITAEKGDLGLTRRGLEEYVADCVLTLDHLVVDQVATRRLRVVKYRGSAHQTNEYPFLIGAEGISVTPLTSLGLDHPAPTQRISTGVERLDTMLGGEGYFRGSSVLVTGTAGSGKTSLAASFVRAAARAGERCLYFAFEESRQQILRNMRAIGLHLEPHEQAGTLRFVNARPGLRGLESHLASMHEAIREYEPAVVVIDPISNLVTGGNPQEVRSMLARLIDAMKSLGVTALCTDLTEGSEAIEATGIGISSLMDTWILLQNLSMPGEKNRGLYVLKARGTAHSNQIREFVLSSEGIRLLDVYVGAGQVLTGSARVQQETKDRRALEERQRADLEADLARTRRQAVLRAQLAALQAELDDQTIQDGQEEESVHRRNTQGKSDDEALSQARFADPKRGAP